MKTIKIILLFAMVLTFVACSGENLDNDTTQSAESTAVIYEGLLPTFLINADDGDFRTAIVNEVAASRATSSEDRVREENKVSDLKQFYYPNIEIDGFSLYQVTMTAGGICFYYAPVGVRNYVFNYRTGIQLAIIRTDHKFDDMTYPVTIGKASATIGGRIIDDNLSFAETVYEYNELAGIIGDTWFIMQVPKSIDNDAAIEIGRRLISTAELVNVDEEIGRLSQ